MIPIRDDTPRFSTPYVTYFLIALNTVIFLWEWSVGLESQQELNALIFQFGVVPRKERCRFIACRKNRPSIDVVATRQVKEILELA